MTKTLFDAKGNAIRLGREIGRGGEGSVFDVDGRPALVAKVYHSALGSGKQAKLAHMVSAVDKSILGYAAWPQETLHAQRNGPVNGFLMDKVVNRQPIHMLYSPAHRKQEFPRAGWDFLVFVARNTAAAFSTIHSYGHVIGDVNQGNVVVGSDSKVSLIDCDSFQINAKGKLHLCEVGVPHYTPPELQGTTAFDKVPRTANHDNFGLALLVFHLLFGGRHPFSGVPLRNDVGNQLEADIKAFRFAYSHNSRARGLEPPPRSVTLALVPPTFGILFERAFTEPGASGAGRPTASEWVSALDQLRAGTRKCSASSMHIYPTVLKTCPWCDLDSKGVVYFIDTQVHQHAGSSGFHLASVWAAIEAIPAPVAIAMPTSNFKAVPQPLPAECQSARNSALFARTVIIALGIIATIAKPALFMLALVLGGLAWMMFGKINYGPERDRRAQQLIAAERRWNSVTARWDAETGPGGFAKTKSELARLRAEYESLGAKEQQGIEELKRTAEHRQKQRYLERFFISDAGIPGVGPGRTATLASHGIETAADVTASRIKNVKGFGESLTRSLVDWKKQKELGFRFNASAAVTSADIATVRNKFLTMKVQIEKSLSAGPEQLKRYRTEQQNRAASLQSVVLEAASDLAQARADVAAM